jgi:cytochrome c-type biogenesis protein CcmH/NrfG
MITTGGAAGIALGVGVLLLPIIGVVLVGYELRFGWQTQVLARRLAEEDLLPDDSELARRASGRVERDAADAHFEVVRTEVEAAPEDWRGWYRLAHAYDLAGDRKRARSAMRHAIELSQAG